LNNPGTFNFVYKIKSESGDIQEDVMSIRIVNLKDAFDINSYSINLDSDEATVFVRNRVPVKFDNITVRFHSAFFDFTQRFPLDSYEKKEFEVTLNKDKIKDLVAGEYILTADIETNGVKERIENNFKFTEKKDISTEETKSGLLISKTVVKKINEGNLPSVVQVKIDKNIISRLFTTFNIEPDKVEREGFVVSYIFQKELRPAESFNVRATTSWVFPLLIIAAIVIIVYLIQVYAKTHVMLRKRAAFVRTKGGEFALKITLLVKARSFVEKVNVVDKIPSLVKVYGRFGAVEPDNIDEKNRRLEWNLDVLQPQEERVLSYVVYSKVAPIGKFELPTATAVYEKEGKVHEVTSNKVFFLTEPSKGAEE
jgi:hypothetical protein